MLEPALGNKYRRLGTALFPKTMEMIERKKPL